MIFEETNKIRMRDHLFVPGARCNLLRRDLQVQLVVRVLPEGDKIVVKLLQLNEEGEKQIKVV